MADGIEEFNLDRNLAKVATAFKGGTLFNNPITHPEMEIVDGYPDSVSQKLSSGKVDSMPIQDSWPSRRK